MNDFTQEMFSVQGIEVLGTPLVTDFYVKITRDVETLEPLTDGFIHFQVIQKTRNTCTEYMSVNITLSPQEQFLSAQDVHVDMTIANDILKKGTRDSFQFWGNDDLDLAVKIIQNPHTLGVFGLTPNVIEQTSAKVAMTSRFLGLVGSLPLDEHKQLWFPNQQTYDPDSWIVPHLLQLKVVYDVLVNKYRCKVQEMYTVQDHPPPPSEFLLLPLLDSLYKDHVRNQELPQPGDSRPVKSPSQHALSKQMMNCWGPWETNMQKSTNSRMLQQLAFHTQQTIKTTSTQDLDPLPLDNNYHSSVLSFEMYTLESGEPPSRTLNWNPLEFLSHIKRRTNDEIICRHAELSLRIHRFMIGWYTVWVSFVVRWVTELRSTR